MPVADMRQFDLAADLLVLCRDHEDEYPALVPFAQEMFLRAAEELHDALHSENRCPAPFAPKRGGAGRGDSLP